MQTLVSVVNGKERKMLGAPLVAGTGGPFSSGMGKQRCRRIESAYPIYVTSTEQDKPVSLPERERSTARWIDSGSGMRSERKPMLLCNGTDIGCVGHIDNITERESELTSLCCCTREN